MDDGYPQTGQVTAMCIGCNSSGILFPAGEKLIKGAASAFWDAWLIGLEQSGYNVQRELNKPDREPMEPEM